MQYLCVKQLPIGGKTYYPGDTIPDGVIFPDRVKKLSRNGYISELKEDQRDSLGRPEKLYTLEETSDMIAEAVDRAVKNMGLEMEQKELQEAAGFLQEEGFLSDSTVIISVKGNSDGDNEQQTAVLATPEEIQQVFNIMQMNATDGAEAIAKVKSENVLILLHAADSRKTIKDAAKKQADNIFSTSGSTNESTGGNATTGTNTEGVDI